MTIFKFTQVKDQYGFTAENTPMDELRVISPYRLVGSIFTGTTIDTNFWTSTPTNSATNTQANNQITMAAGTNSAGSAILQSVRKARYIGSSSNRFRAQIRLSDAGKTNNTKRWGMFDGTDGAYFKLVGTAMSVCTIKTGSETAVASASWNGSTTTPTLTNCNTFEIYITNKSVYFVINGVLVHTVTASETTWADTTLLPIRLDNINSGNTTDTTIEVRVATIVRLGSEHTLSKYFHFTTAATTVLKYGAGMLHRVILNNPVGTAISLFDNTVGSGTTIAIINAPAQANPQSLEYMIAFEVGLTMVTTGTWDGTIVYE